MGGVSASPELDCLVFVSAVQGACGVAGDSLRSPLTAVPSTKCGWLSGEAEMWLSGLSGIAGAGGGCQGERSISGREPAHAGEPPRADHERGVLVLDLVLIELCRLVGGSAVRAMMPAGVVTPDLPKPAESGGVEV